MKWDSKNWGTAPEWVIAIAAVLTLFLKYSSTELAAWAIVGFIVLGIIWISKGKIYKIALKMRVPKISIKWLGFTLRTSTLSLVLGIVALAISFFYTDHLPVALGKVLKEEGTIIAKATEQCILECVRENNEKVIITLVDSEEVRNVIYRDALDQAQAKDKGYIEFIDGRYRTSYNWVEIPFTLIDDITPGEKKLVLRLKDERGEKVSLRSNKVQAYLSDEQKILLREEIGNNSILLTEDERNVIKDCLKKYKVQDLYSLMYSVLNDPNMLKELRRKKAYDVEYYEFRLPEKDKPIAKGEKKVKLSNSDIIIKKTTEHLTPYEKISIIGCYIDELR